MSQRSLSSREYAAVAQLLVRGPLTMRELGEMVDISQPAMRDLIGRLERAGVVTEAGVDGNSGRRGPQARQYAAVASLTVIAAAEVQPGWARVCLTDIAGELRADSGRIEDERAEPLVLMLRAFDAAVTSGDVDRSAISHLVVATPGIVDGDGELVFVDSHVGWGTGLADALAQELDCDVRLENDLNLVAVAECRAGNGRDVDTLAVIWPEGPGASIVFDGRLIRGTHGYAGELGLVLNDDPDHVDLVARAARMCLTVCAVIDPERILLAGDAATALGESFLSEVRARLVAASPLRPDVDAAGFRRSGVIAGAIAAALDHARVDCYGDIAAQQQLTPRVLTRWAAEDAREQHEEAGR